MEMQRNEKSQNNLGGKIGRLTLPDFNSYKANGNEDVVLASKQTKKSMSPEIDSHIEF